MPTKPNNTHHYCRCILTLIILLALSPNTYSQNPSNTNSAKSQKQALQTGTDSGVFCICKIGSLPSIVFKTGSATSNVWEMPKLNEAACKLKGNPGCSVKFIITGYANKKRMQLQNKRLQAIKKYLVEKQGISENRLSPGYENYTDHEFMVDLIPVRIVELARK